MPREQVHHFCYTPVDTCRKARQGVAKLTHIDKLNARVVNTTEARALALKWNPGVDLVALGLDRRRGADQLTHARDLGAGTGVMRMFLRYPW
eukprot:4712165-Amphidinium_carterae.1